MLSKIIYMISSVPANIYNRITISRHRVASGKNLSINGKCYFRGYGTYRFGNDVFINSSPNVNPSAGGTYCHFTVGKDAELIIGNNVGISHLQLTAEKSVVIEDNVLIGSNCMIADTDFHSLNAEERANERIKGKCNVKFAPIRIREGAFIGARSIILKGVTIGCNAIVGAGSVVSRDVPDGEVWAGNPIVKIR